MAVIYASQSVAGKKPVDPRLTGVLALIDLRDPANASVTKLMGIGHHPDSIAVTKSGDELLAIIAIENEPLIVVDGKVVDDDAPGNINEINPAWEKLLGILSVKHGVFSLLWVLAWCR